MRLTWISLTLTFLASPALATDVTFALTGENTKIQFVGSKPDGSKHEGGFKTVTGTAMATQAGLKIAVEITMDSLYSDSPILTGHLKSPDFFGVKANPTSKFVSTKIESAGNVFNVTGELTLNGKTKSITFPATISLTTENFTLAAEFRINRHEIGITYGKGTINDEVVLKLAVMARR